VVGSCLHPPPPFQYFVNFYEFDDCTDMVGPERLRPMTGPVAVPAPVVAPPAFQMRPIFNQPSSPFNQPSSASLASTGRQPPPPQQA